MRRVSGSLCGIRLLAPVKAVGSPLFHQETGHRIARTGGRTAYLLFGEQMVFVLSQIETQYIPLVCEPYKKRTAWNLNLPPVFILALWGPLFRATDGFFAVGTDGKKGPARLPIDILPPGRYTKIDRFFRIFENLREVFLLITVSTLRPGADLH